MEIGGRGRGEGGNSQVGSADVEVKAAKEGETQAEREKALKVLWSGLHGLNCRRSGFNPWSGTKIPCHTSTQQGQKKKKEKGSVPKLWGSLG